MNGSRTDVRHGLTFARFSNAAQAILYIQFQVFEITFHQVSALPFCKKQEPNYYNHIQIIFKLIAPGLFMSSIKRFILA